jgi:putative addiction module killer protein/probable addiction module antidote protein
VSDTQKTEEFDKWLSSLADQKVLAKIASRVERLGLGNPGDVKPVGEGVSEMRVPYGPGYRVYFKQTDKAIILLLCGGDKSTQVKDIKRAKKNSCGTMKGKQMVKISKFDAADYLKTPEAIAAYLTEAFATDDAAYICAALDTIARAKGIASVAKETGLSRESLYKSFSGSSKPEFDTVRKVINSFGVRLVAEPVENKVA